MAVMLGLFGASGLLAAGAAVESDEEIHELDDFVVEGQYLYTDQVNALKSPTPIIDVPQSLSITTAAEIREQGFESIGDIVNYTPGVTNAQGEGHRDAVVIRGMRSTADFFVDRIRDDVEHYRSLYNVAQLEILRGPNALLFGRGGTGGIINRVMKKGIIGNTFTEYQLTLDSFGSFGAQIDSNASIGEEWAIRINAFYDNLENHRDHYDGDLFGVNPTLRTQLGKATRLDVAYEYNDHERFIDRGIPTGADGRPVRALEDVFFGDRDISESQYKSHVVRASLQHRFSTDLKGHIDFAYGDYDKFYENFYAVGWNAAAEEVTLDGYVDSTDRRTLTLSGSLIGEFETGRIKHTVVSGVEFIETGNNNDRVNSFFDQTSDDNEVFKLADLAGFRGGVGVNANGDTTTNDFTDPRAFGDDTHADINVLSIFIQDEIALSEKLDLILGVRFDRFDFKVDVRDASGAVTATRKQVDEEVVPRLGLIYKPQEDVSLYVSYSQTFLPKSGDQFASISRNSLGLDPDEFINMEAGVKWDIHSKTSLTAAVFGLQQDATETDGIGNFFEVESAISGFEAQIKSQITDNWYLSAGYSYLDGEITDETDPTVDGNRPRELPRHAFSLWNRYQVTERFGLGLGLIYQDETYITEDNDTVLPSFTRVDAALYYRLSENLRLQVNVENLTDRLYFPHAHGDHQATVGAPINARFALMGRF